MARKRKHRRRGNPGARRRSHSRRRRNPGVFPLMNRGRRGRRRRRNPFGGGGRGLLGQATQAGMDAVGIVTGKVASRAIPALLNLGMTGIMGVAIQAASAVAAGWAASKVNRNFGRMVTAGGFAGILEGYAKLANIPVISPALGDEYDAVMGSYLPGVDNDGMGRYLPAGGGLAGDAGAGGEDITDSVNMLPG